jgi:hypothetical protein
MAKKTITEVEKQKYLAGAEEIKKYLQLFKETGKANTQKECAKLLTLYWQSANTRPCSKDTFNKYCNADTYFDKLNETTLSNILKTLKFIEKKDLQLPITTIPDEHKILKHYTGYYYFYYSANGEDGNIMKEGCHLEYRDNDLYFENQHFAGKFVLEIGYIYLETRQKDEKDKPQKCIYLLTPHQVTLNETIDVFTWVALSNAAPVKGYVGSNSHFE